MAKPKKYELYKKSKFVTIATLDEICEITGLSKSYMMQSVVTKSHRHRSPEWTIYAIEEMIITLDNGKIITIEDPINLAKELNIERYRLSTEIKRRVDNAGWSIKKALTQKIKKRKSWDNLIFSMYKGEEPLNEGTVFELSEETGYSVAYLKRIANESITNKGDWGLTLVLLDDEEME